MFDVVKSYGIADFVEKICYRTNKYLYLTNFYVTRLQLVRNSQQT